MTLRLCSLRDARLVLVARSANDGRRSVVRLEDSATYAAALTLVHAGRTVAAADRYVKRHPWGSVLLAASAALAMTAAAGRRHMIHSGQITLTAKSPSKVRNKQV